MDLKKETTQNIIILILISIITIFVVRFAVESNKYTIVSTVCAFDYDIDMVTVETNSRQLYSFYGIEDWTFGDKCIMIMDSMGTKTLTDDRILSVKHEHK